MRFSKCVGGLFGRRTYDQADNGIKSRLGNFLLNRLERFRVNFKTRFLRICLIFSFWKCRNDPILPICYRPVGPISELLHLPHRTFLQVRSSATGLSEDRGINGSADNQNFWRECRKRNLTVFTKYIVLIYNLEIGPDTSRESAFLSNR